MKAGWKTVKLGEVADIYNGNTIPDKEKKRLLALPNSGLPFIATKDVGFDGVVDYENGINIPKVEAVDFKVAKADAVLVCAEGGSAGRKIGHINRDVHFGNKLFALNATHAVNPRYLYHFCQSEDFRKKFKSLKAGLIGGVSVAKFKIIEIPLPPLAEQKRIVALLDEAFAGIDEAKAKAETNNENAKAVFARHLKSVFQDAPEDWIVRTIGDVCALKSGTTVAANIEKSFGDIPYLKVADMNIPANRNEITTSSRFLDKSDVKSANIIPAGSTIFPKRGGAILTNKKRVTTVPICADLNIMAAIPSDVLDSTFLYFYFLGVDMKKLGGGSSIPQINNYDIAPLLVCLPTNIETQRQVARKLADIREKTQTLNMLLEQKLARLSDLKKSLLSQAFAGELNA